MGTPGASVLFSLSLWHSSKGGNRNHDSHVRFFGSLTLPGTNMEVEGHLLVVETCLPRGHSQLPC